MPKGQLLRVVRFCLRVCRWCALVFQVHPGRFPSRGARFERNEPQLGYAVSPGTTIAKERREILPMKSTIGELVPLEHVPVYQLWLYEND